MPATSAIVVIRIGPQSDGLVALYPTGSRQPIAVPFLKELEEELVGFSRIRHPSGTWGFSGKANGTDDLLMALAMGVGYACLVHKPRSLER